MLYDIVINTLFINRLEFYQPHVHRFTGGEGFGQAYLVDFNAVFALEQQDFHHVAVCHVSCILSVAAGHDESPHWVSIGAHTAHIKRSCGAVADVQQVFTAFSDIHRDCHMAIIIITREESHLRSQAKVV